MLQSADLRGVLNTTTANLLRSVDINPTQRTAALRRRYANYSFDAILGLLGKHVPGETRTV